MTRVRGNTKSFTRPHRGLFSSEGGLDFANEKREGFLEIVAMRGEGHHRRVECAYRLSSIRPFVSCRESRDRVGITNEPNVRQTLVGIRVCYFEGPLRIVSGNRRSGLGSDGVFVHDVGP